MRSLFFCLPCLFWPAGPAFTAESQEPDFEIQIKKNESCLKGTIRLSAEILKKYLNQDLLKNHLANLEKLEGIRKDDYEIEEIKKSGQLIGLELRLKMNEKTKVAEIALLIEKLPDAAFAALPEIQRVKIRSLLTMMKLYKNLPAEAKGEWKIAALLPASGKTASEQAEIRIHVEIKY